MRKISIYAPCHLYLPEAKSDFHKAHLSWLGKDGQAGEEGEGGTSHQPTPFPSRRAILQFFQVPSALIQGTSHTEVRIAVGPTLRAVTRLLPNLAGFLRFPVSE